MDAFLIEQWNKKVKKGSVVYHLGDFCFSRTLSVFVNKLNGTIHLIRGNHDRVSSEQAKSFHWVKDYYRLKVEKQKIVLSHYPFARWDCQHHGAWHLHGHCHNSYTIQRGKILDVGIDGREDYSPWHYDEIEEYMSSRLI